VRFNITFAESFDLPADHYSEAQVLISYPNQHSLTAAPTATPFDT